MSSIDLPYKVIAEIKQNETILALSEDNRNLPKKTISTDDFIEIMSSMKKENVKKESPLLPGSYGTKKTAVIDDNYYILLTTPPEVKTIKYSYISPEHFIFEDPDSGYERAEYNDEAMYSVEDYLNSHGIPIEDSVDLEVYVPSLVWLIHVRQTSDDDNKFRHIRDLQFAIDNPILSMDDAIYKSPLTNVYNSDSICWGGISLPEGALSGVSSYERLFFNGYANLDLDDVFALKTEYNNYEFKSKTLKLIENAQILEEEGIEKAKEHMNKLIRDMSRIAHGGTNHLIGDVWDEFTRQHN